VRIETDSTALTQALLDLVDVMNAAGATFQPGLRIVGASGQISAWADGDEPWLMRIPTSSLVPIEGVTWSGEPPLRIASAPGELTSLQVEVLEACTAVMAAAGTWEHFRPTHPRATVTDPEAIAIIQSLHPAFPPATSAAAMLKTRTIKLAVDDEEPTSYLMPMLDLVNHHPEAPAYARDDGYLSIGTWRAADNVASASSPTARRVTSSASPSPTDTSTRTSRVPTHCPASTPCPVAEPCACCAPRA